jgi:membrane protein YdbS with pleckstrin-like domain
MIPLIIALVAGLVAIYFYFNTKEEMLKLASAFVAVVCLVSGLWFAPLLVKLLVVATPFVGEKLQ